MLWKEGLLIKLKLLGIKGKMFQWIKGFLSDRVIQIKVNGEVSESYSVENGVPQGSIISPLLFSIMIDDVQNSVGVALFADDGAMWKKGRNVDFVVDKVQQAVNKVQQWAIQWGFRISIDKTKTLFFSRKGINLNVKFKLSGVELERVEFFKYLGIWFDKRLTWTIHIQKMIDKCKKVLNVMRWSRMGSK